MADEAATETTDTETSTTEATEQTTTDKVADDTGADKTAETESGEAETDKSLMTGGKGPDDEPEEEEEQDEAAQLPDKYDLTPPEGFEINDELLAEVSPVFKELKLSNEQANKLMPLAGKFAERLVSAQNDAFQAQATDWAKKAKADSEIGGRNWKETETLVARALDRLEAPKEFRALLGDTKLGNHPEMIRMFRRVGAAIGEDGDFPRSDAGAPVKADRLATLYPNDVPQKEGAN